MRRTMAMGRPHVGTKLGAVLLAAAVFGLPALLTLTLKHQGEQGVHAEVHLQLAASELRIQDGLEWRAISGRMPLKDVRDELVAARERGEHQLSEAGSGGLPSGAVDQITAVSNRYSEVVDEELRLLSLGESERALEFDETQVDPAFEKVLAVVENQGQEMHDRAESARLFSDLGLLLTVLLSLILVSVVQGRRKRAEVRHQAKQQSDARYRTLIDQSADLVLVVNRVGQADFLSPSVERLLASAHRALPAVDAAGSGPIGSGSTGSAPLDVIAEVDPQDRPRLSAALEAATPGRGSAVEVRITGGRGVRTFAVSVQDLTAERSIGGLVLTAHDITDRLTLQREIEHRALHDALTGLPNRTLLLDRIDQALRADARAGTRTGLLLLDLDRFKQINDTFGHHHGDEVLTQVGPRLTGVVREVDTVARLAGDEFVVLLPDVGSVADVTAVAAKLRAALETPFQVEGIDLDVEVSVGVVLSGEHGNEATILLQHADIAMYAAKTQNLGVSVYDPAADGHSPARLALFGDLRRALDRRELVMHYQPKVSVSTGAVVGAEALVRWQHPERGLLFPDEFIPITENTGLIGPLTLYVLDAALAQARTWSDAGRALPVSVNMSARNLLDLGLPGQVEELLALHGVEAEMLELEVTESAIMTEPVRARRLLEQLAALGVRVSIDDFGVGYTSLGQLKHLPVSELKIDRSFVTTMTEDPSNALIVHSLIDLGHSLGLNLVAEGVETQQALDALAEMGCDVAQGYFLSRPVTAEAFDAWHAERRTAPEPAHLA